jgi:hypothetical protein
MISLFISFPENYRNQHISILIVNMQGTCGRADSGRVGGDRVGSGRHVTVGGPPRLAVAVLLAQWQWASLTDSDGPPQQRLLDLLDRRR